MSRSLSLEPAQSDAPPAWAALGRGLLLLAGLLVAGWALRRLDWQSYAHSPHGPLVLVAGGALLCAVGMPRQIVAFACGYALGLWPGLAVALMAQGLGCAADFGWARVVGRDWARRRLGGAWRRLDRALSAQPFTATLALRLLPVGNNLLLNLAAGLSGISPGAFLAASLLGYLPQTLIFLLAGTGVRFSHASELAVAGTLFAASAALGLLLMRRLRATSA